MHAMQYEIILPADYEMSIIRNRVSENGHRLDAFPGLGLKAYLIREKGVAGSPINSYAPFYLWANTTGMADFLYRGGGFSGIVSSFGRPSVKTWIGLQIDKGPSYKFAPTHATRQLDLIPPHCDPSDWLKSTQERTAAEGKESKIHLSAIGIDPVRWEFVTFKLWCGEPGPIIADRFEILHISRPEIEAIAK